MRKTKYMELEDVRKLAYEMHKIFDKKFVKIVIEERDVDKYDLFLSTHEKSYHFILNDYRLVPVNKEMIGYSMAFNDALYEVMYEKYGYQYYNDYLAYWNKTYKDYIKTKHFKNKSEIIKNYKYVLTEHVNSLSTKVDYKKMGEKID